MSARWHDERTARAGLRARMDGPGNPRGPDTSIWSMTEISRSVGIGYFVYLIRTTDHTHDRGAIVSGSWRSTGIGVLVLRKSSRLPDIPGPFAALDPSPRPRRRLDAGPEPKDRRVDHHWWEHPDYHQGDPWPTGPDCDRGTREHHDYPRRTPSRTRPESRSGRRSATVLASPFPGLARRCLRNHPERTMRHHPIQRLFSLLKPIRLRRPPGDSATGRYRPAEIPLIDYLLGVNSSTTEPSTADVLSPSFPK